METPRNATRLLRLDEVLARVPLGKASVYRAIRQKRFPPPCKLLGGRASAWDEASSTENPCRLRFSLSFERNGRSLETISTDLVCAVSFMVYRAAMRNCVENVSFRIRTEKYVIEKRRFKL